MPYKGGSRLPPERASKLGHLEVLKSPLVDRLCSSFEQPAPSVNGSSAKWEDIPKGGEPLSIVFGVDGSLQPIRSDLPPYKELTFIKTALLKLDTHSMSKIDKDSPHPFAVRDLLIDSAIYHATVLPMRHVSIPGMNTYNAVRRIIFESLKDESLGGEPMETLKWIAYDKWSGEEQGLKPFGCPHCEEVTATLPFDAEEGRCPNCDGPIFITDMLGFHLEMSPDAASESVATAYMNVHETLLLFTGVRFFWETNRQLLTKCLFVKDGPLSLRASYQKIVQPIRRFITFANSLGYPVCIIGQEKTGNFADHLEVIGRTAPNYSLFMPDEHYIKRQILNGPERRDPYGYFTHYGAKVFVKLDDHHMALNIATGPFVSHPTMDDLIGGDRIFATIPTLLSHRHENAIIPIELAHGIASLSTYPSAQILKMFACQ